jgi:hypothetical protein
MKGAGWRPKVVDFEKHLVLDAQPGTREWSLLQEAVAELAKLRTTVEGKLHRKETNTRAEEKERLAAVRQALEEDKERRRLKFQPLSTAVAAMPPRPAVPASPVSPRGGR